MKADGSVPKQVTNLSTEAGGVLFSPDGKRLVFTSEIYPDCPDDACNKKRLEAEKASNQGLLKLTRWRSGKAEEVQLKLRVMGSYSATAPYACPTVGENWKASAVKGPLP